MSFGDVIKGVGWVAGKVLQGTAWAASEFAQVLQAHGSNFNSIQKYAKKQRKRKCWNRQEAKKPEIDMDQQRKKAINEA